jgi:hypothetical protein
VQSDAYVVIVAPACGRKGNNPEEVFVLSQGNTLDVAFLPISEAMVPLEARPDEARFMGTATRTARTMNNQKRDNVLEFWRRDFGSAIRSILMSILLKTRPWKPLDPFVKYVRLSDGDRN